MDIEAIKQMAIDVNNVAAASYQSGKDHIERPLLAKIERLQAENEKLKKFCREFISIECWGCQPEIDGGNVHEVAEKCGLIESHIATEKDVYEDADFEEGDTVYRFTNILKGTKE